jgi:hypothetical protein
MVDMPKEVKTYHKSVQGLKYVSDHVKEKFRAYNKGSSTARSPHHGLNEYDMISEHSLEEFHAEIKVCQNSS